MRRSSFLLLAVVPLLGGACASGQYLTRSEIESHGTRVYAVESRALADAAARTLQVMGYEVALSDPERGLVKTGRKLIRAQAIGGPGGAQSSGIYRQYQIAISPAGEAGSRIEVTPSVFVGERDMSREDVWVIEGPEGERQLWDDYFRELEQVLGI